MRLWKQISIIIVLIMLIMLIVIIMIKTVKLYVGLKLFESDFKAQLYHPNQN